MKVYIGRYPSMRTLRKNPVAERKVSVRVDPWDTWSLDSTLALIIHPCLVQLRDTNHGYPEVDLEDVPEALRGDSGDDPGNARWLWVMDEMIWAFGQVNSDWEDEFYSGEHDMVTVPVAGDGSPWTGDPKKAPLYEWRPGPNHTFVFDKEGYSAHFDRMKNGMRLFGKYYFNLWD